MKRKTKNPAAWIWRAIKPYLSAVLFWAVVLWITAELYAAASAYALLERGYKAIGGEAFIWLLPAAVYILKRWAAGAIRRAKPIDADYIVIPRATTEDLAEATVKLSRTMAAVGVSASEAATAFYKMNEAEREAHKLAISRRKHAELFNENFSPSSLYSTLTFDDEHEVHTFGEASRILDLYIRRLKYSYPAAVIFAYMGRGKSTARIHIHIVSEGVPEDAILKKWGLGAITRIEHLREHCYYNGVDHGRDYTGLATYLFNHWTPEQGGHRWKQTRNARKPEREEPTEVKREYTENRPPRPPKGYILVESTANSWGYLYFKYVVEPPKKKAKKKPPRPIE